MNAFRFEFGSHQNRWLLVATLCVAAAGCNDPATQDQASKPTEQVSDGVILANNDGSMPEVQGLVASTAVRISLPRDQSTFPPGPSLGAVDTTVCNTCHTPTDIAGFVTPPGPGFKLVNDQCRECHSADYTSSQPILTRPAWQKVVVKMADKFGAERIKLVENGIAKDHPHQSPMLDYLVAVYGKP